MESQLLEAAKRLSLGERVDLVEAIWDSIADEADQLPLTPEQIRILDARLAEHQASPLAGEGWDELRARLLSSRK